MRLGRRGPRRSLSRTEAGDRPAGPIMGAQQKKEPRGSFDVTVFRRAMRAPLPSGQSLSGCREQLHRWSSGSGRYRSARDRSGFRAGRLCGALAMQRRCWRTRLQCAKHGNMLDCDRLGHECHGRLFRFKCAICAVISIVAVLIDRAVCERQCQGGRPVMLQLHGSLGWKCCDAAFRVAAGNHPCI